MPALATLDQLKISLQVVADAIAELERGGLGDEVAPAHPQRAVDGDPGHRVARIALTAAQKQICEQVVNVFETGSPVGDYAAVSIYRDGPGDIRQITYGRSQTTEYGNLKQLVAMYVAANGTFAAAIRPYLDRIGAVALVDDAAFLGLLRRAGAEDPVMRQTQDDFFDAAYFQPAMRWATNNGFREALSMLVIYDSCIHSGSILGFLRERFEEVPPAQGGDERRWISQYLAARDTWLSTHSRPAVRASRYRTRDLLREVGRGNWALAELPIVANGTPVGGGGGASPTRARFGIAADGAGLEGASPLPDDEEWSELEPPAAARRGDTLATLAAQILNHPNIKLATVHVSGVDDGATARENIVDTAAGRRARRSAYGNAPGGEVAVEPRMLRGLLALADDYSFAVSELCGGSHSAGSPHYLGGTADINYVDGVHVGPNHPKVAAFQERCRALGADKVLGPGYPHHDTHVHAGWPVGGSDGTVFTIPALPASAEDERVLADLAAPHGLAVPMRRLIAMRNRAFPGRRPRFWAIADFDLPSTERRLFVFDAVGRAVDRYLVAHGIGSEGPSDDGHADAFSDVPGSKATSLGIYDCGETYISARNGLSLRLEGLEDSNASAFERLIVMHGADYVSDAFVAAHGRIGRSEGCPALDRAVAERVIGELERGSLLMHWKTD